VGLIRREAAVHAPGAGTVIVASATSRPALEAPLHAGRVRRFTTPVPARSIGGPGSRIQPGEIPVGQAGAAAATSAARSAQVIAW
jgi:hypothetical protein